MMRHILKLLLITLTATISSCGGSPALTDGEQAQLYNRLNTARFISIDSLGSVIREATPDRQGTLANSSAYIAFMQMDYEKSRKTYDSIISHTDNELERFEAILGIMRISNRTSADRKYHDYRAKAIRTMQRIDEEASNLTPAHITKYNGQRLEFHILSANHYAAMGMYEKYANTVTELQQFLPLTSDTATILNANLVNASSRSNTLAERFRILFRGATRSRLKGYQWLTGHYKLMLATMLRDQSTADSISKISPAMLADLNSDTLPLTQLPRKLATEALEAFHSYGDRYMTIKGLAILASCHTYNGEYEKALKVAAHAIDEINQYYNDYSKKADNLPPYTLHQTEESPESQRMAHSDIASIPECMLLIRNEASCAYAALGNKEASDMNRNSYLDLLHITRQNREIESRINHARQSADRMQNTLTLLVALLILTTILSIHLIRRWRTSNKAYTKKLLSLQHLCHELTTFPLSSEFNDEEEAAQSLSLLLTNTLRNIIPTITQITIDADGTATDRAANRETYPLDHGHTLNITGCKETSREDKSLIEITIPYINTALHETDKLLKMSDESQQIEELNRLYILNLVRHKQENAIKRTQLTIAAGIRPYMDRVTAELEKLEKETTSDSKSTHRRLTYIAELTEKINEHNTILERWIKMSHGRHDLNIENFSIKELFDIMAKSTQDFAIKGINLKISGTTAVVKADKALTLFMINTLTENAGKFTPAGGTVELSANESDEYIEISVTDTGAGLTHEEIQKILGAKVYDTASIGADDRQIAKNKRGGFGLMNCKGIIEKYRKTAPLFSVCSMDIQSEKGKGSRFSFRLPKGILRILLPLLMLLPSTVKADTGHITALADSVYMSNVAGNYDSTLHYAGKAIYALNRFYITNSDNTDNQISLTGHGEAAEIRWWKNSFATDSHIEEIYHNILDIRNETAIAMLALGRWDDYHYNNNAYTSLYRLVHEDKELEKHYTTMRHLSNIRRASIILCLILLTIITLGALLYYFKSKIINRINIHTALEINRRLLKSISGRRLDSRQLTRLFADELYGALKETLRIKAVKIAITEIDKEELAISCTPAESDDEYSRLCLKRAYQKSEKTTDKQGKTIIYPLQTTTAGSTKCIGSILFTTETTLSEKEMTMLEIIIGYTASAGSHASISMEQEYSNFDELIEENSRIRHEENLLHIQNQVIDNALSMIKHETIYYPQRIHRLAQQLTSAQSGQDTMREGVTTMRELIDYYRSVYGILTACARSRLKDTVFTPGRFPFDEVATEAIAFAKRRARKNMTDITIQYDKNGHNFFGDKELATYLLESLLAELLTLQQNGTLTITARKQENKLTVELTDSRLHLGKEEAAEIFTPSSTNIAPDATSLTGSGYLIAKEIIRIHEDFTGTYGGKLEAEDTPQGTTIRFTLPA